MPELEKSVGNVWSLPPLISEMRRSRPSREMTTGLQSRTCNKESGVLLTTLVVLKLRTHKNYLERLANTDCWALPAVSKIRSGEGTENLHF